MMTNIFTTQAPVYMARLMQDFGCGLDDAAAVFGNFGHESGGFARLQEIRPAVKGSRGGYGWPQWTGPRRKAYEAYCARNSKNPADADSNYAYVFVELSGPYAAAMAAVKRASGLYDKVVAFERAYEGAGIKHYASRLLWAEKAKAAYLASLTPFAAPPKAPPDVEPPPPAPPLPPDAAPAPPPAPAAGLLAALLRFIRFMLGGKP